MASKSVYIIAPSGSGKTSSIRTLNPETTFIINVLNKDLPWKGSGKQYKLWDKETKTGNMIVTTDTQAVIMWLDYISKTMPHIKNICIDDDTYLTIMELQRRANESWSKYEVIVQNFLDLAAKTKSLRDDIVVFILHHTEELVDDITQEKTYRAMSFGKLLNEKMGGQECQFTQVLRAAKETNGNEIDYVFYTTDSKSTVKTPFELYNSNKIPNDLAYVRKCMDCFYDGLGCEDTPKEEKTKNQKQQVNG